MNWHQSRIWHMGLGLLTLSVIVYMVTHLSIEPTHRCLTLVTKREPVLSAGLDHKKVPDVQNSLRIKKIWNTKTKRNFFQLVLRHYRFLPKLPNCCHVVLNHCRIKTFSLAIIFLISKTLLNSQSSKRAKCWLIIWKFVPKQNILELFHTKYLFEGCLFLLISRWNKIATHCQALED